MTPPTRLPDASSIETVLAGLAATTADARLCAALSQAFPGFAFTLARDGDEYWRDTRSILAPDGTRVAELRPWMTAELAKDHGDVKAVWKRLKDSDLKLTEWSGQRVFAFAPTGAGVADYIQITLCREIEGRVGSIVDPRWPPYGEEELLDPSWFPDGSFSDDDVLAGPIYRLYGPPDDLRRPPSKLPRSLRTTRTGPASEAAGTAGANCRVGARSPRHAGKALSRRLSPLLRRFAARGAVLPGLGGIVCPCTARF